MNESVSIKEGGLTRKFSPIDKVKVNNTDNTDSLWVSKDDMKTGTLYATENGIYIASEDGYDAYDEVVIRVTDESYYGDNTWKVVDPSDDYGIWDDSTYQEYLNDPDSFNDLFNDDTKWQDDDLGENLDYKLDEEDFGKTDTISGIDPETGNEVEYSADEDGFLNEEVLPSYISITSLPERTEFYDGHRIVFSGIAVSAYLEDGTLYKNIPYGELIFPVRIAVWNGDKDGIHTDGQGLNLLRVTFGPDTYYHWYLHYLGPIMGTYPGGQGWGEGGPLNIACGTPGSAYFTMYNDRLYSYSLGAYGSVAGVVVGVNHAYFTSIPSNGWSHGPLNSPGKYMSFPTSEVDPSKADLDNLESQMEVPVQWMRSDGVILETSFTITVLRDPSGEPAPIPDTVVDYDGMINYGGKKYRLNPQWDGEMFEVHYSNGVVWQTGISSEYTVDQAVDRGLLIPV